MVSVGMEVVVKLWVKHSYTKGKNNLFLKKETCPEFVHLFFDQASVCLDCLDECVLRLDECALRLGEYVLRLAG